MTTTTIDYMRTSKDLSEMLGRLVYSALLAQDKAVARSTGLHGSGVFYLFIFFLSLAS